VQQVSPDEPKGADVNAAAVLLEDKKKKIRDEWSAVLSSLAESKDKASFSRLYEYFAPRVKAYIIRFGMSPASAEELTQESMLAVWRKAHLYNRSKASASTWIFTLARNQCIDRLRREKAVEYELPEEEADPDQRHYGEHAVVAQRMEDAIGKLPEAQAQVLYLSYYEGKSHSEIAEQLGIPLGSVKSRLRLAFSKLKAHWSETSEN
jgi:RNA polymerase sigma-70 factor (ECF subfamily)